MNNFDKALTAMLNTPPIRKSKSNNMSRIVAWKTNNKINYKLISDNGETIFNCNQGFERKQGMIKNLKAIATFFSMSSIHLFSFTIHWTKSAKSKTIIKTETINL